ncbi:MAG: ribonuclease [Clostridia bacterium]|nr:ribonuclease [Clostridia bacterium]
MLFSIVGCSAEDIGEGLTLAGDIIDLIDEIEVDGTTATSDTGSVVTEADTMPAHTTEAVTESVIDEDGYYYSKDNVALYLHTYNKLPKNFITKSEAGKLGWEGGSVERYREGAAIGGDKFGNREGLLPKKDGRVYYECDIDTYGKSERGEKRIVYSNDGLIYYTGDHYESFTLLYGEE